jgi:hypothetical protein
MAIQLQLLLLSRLHTRYIDYLCLITSRLLCVVPIFNEPVHNFLLFNKLLDEDIKDTRLVSQLGRSRETLRDEFCDKRYLVPHEELYYDRGVLFRQIQLN